MIRSQVTRMLADLSLERERVLSASEEWRCPWTGLRVIVMGGSRPTVRLRVPDALVDDSKFENVGAAQLISAISETREAWETRVKTAYETSED